ncbi:MAG: ABC transporter substrate-binding protein [Burkholderiales bacterium]|nr:ABC transporter substrate-binding protein [Burkholderiales bacterium]
MAMGYKGALFAAVAASAFAWTASASAQDIVLGLAMVKSGPLKSVGEATETSVDIAVEEINAKGGINGKKIKLVKFDTGSDPKQAATATQKFAQDDNALAIIGPFSSGEAAVAFPVGERIGIIQMPNAASTPGLTANFSYAWRLTADEGKQFNRLIATLRNKQIKIEKAEIIYVSDERVSNISGTQFYPAILKANNVAFGEPVAVQYKSFDVAPQVAQVLERKPDVVALAATPDSAGKVIKELRRQGFQGRVIGSQIFADPNALELFGRDADGLLIVAGYWSDRNDATRSFTKKFADENAKRGLVTKKIPHHTDAQAYDIVYLLKQAMEKAGVTGDPAKVAAERTAIREAMKGIRFTGVTGDGTCFNAARDAQLPGFVIEIKDLKWNLFDQHAADPCPAS